MDEKEKQRRQYYLRLAGYNASGDWNSEQEKAWLELTTKLKEYQPTLNGFLSAIWDKITANDTYLQDPEEQGEIKSDDRTEFARNLDYMASHNDNPIGYAWQTVIPAAPAGGLKIAPKIVLGLAKSPLKTTLIGARTLIPAGLAGYGVSAATDAVSEATTGKSLEENVSPYTGRTFSFLADPGNYVGAKTAYNFYNLGRYVMDELSPNAYSLKGVGSVLKATGRALNPFTNPPKFGNGRNPKWYSTYSNIIGDREHRLQNSAIWAEFLNLRFRELLYIVDQMELMVLMRRLLKESFLLFLKQKKHTAIQKNIL